MAVQLMPTTGRSAKAAATGEFSFGLEEEYFLADARTMLAAPEAPDAFFEEIASRTGGRVVRESLQAQVEVNTSAHVCAADARIELAGLRKTVAVAAAEHGLVILAAGTHPTAQWESVAPTPKDRYSIIMDDLQMIGRRNMLCGMHVHVALPDPERRVDVMLRMLPYLPLLLALSTSSPFWRSRPTGLKGYRLAAYNELPRSGLPELFRTAQEYDAYLAALIRSGVMRDASFVWWAIRPSHNFPTLELRAPDCCTRLDDAIAIAALYCALARFLYMNAGHNADLGAAGRGIAVENMWRAQRYGVRGAFVSEKGAIGVANMLEDVIEMTASDAEALGCAAQIGRCRKVILSGTSADIQLEIFEAHRREGLDAALKAVVEWLADTTLQL